MSQPCDRTALLADGNSNGNGRAGPKPVNSYNTNSDSPPADDAKEQHFNLHNLSSGDFYWILVGLWSS